MCRFVAYIGEPLLMNSIVSRTKDSLIKQSFEALESDIALNADGFGVGWYRPDVSSTPAVYVSVLPAWNDLNLLNISHLVVSPCFFGHVRATDDRTISLYNCHPFHHHNYLFMHNGTVAGFKKIKLALLNLIEPEYFNMIKGNTDSEALFALRLSYYSKSKKI